MTSRPKPKIKLPTLKQLERALPLVSAGLSILSSLPFNKKVTKTLAVAAAETGGKPQTNNNNNNNTAVRDQLRTALDELTAAAPETPPTRIAELTTRALTLARIMVTNDD